MSLYCGRGRERGSFFVWEWRGGIDSCGYSYIERDGGDVIVDICPELWLGGLGGGGFNSVRGSAASQPWSVVGKTQRRL